MLLAYFLQHTVARSFYSFYNAKHLCEILTNPTGSPSLTAPQLCAEFTVVGHSSAVSIFHQN